MPTQKSIDYKETAVNYYLVEDKTQEEVCQIFNCSRYIKYYCSYKIGV